MNLASAPVQDPSPLLVVRAALPPDDCLTMAHRLGAQYCQIEIRGDYLVDSIPARPINADNYWHPQGIGYRAIGTRKTIAL